MSAALTSFYQLIGQQRYSYPEQTAVVCDEQRFSFAEMYERSTGAAAMLASFDVGARDRVLWLGQNTHVMLELLLACSRVGATLCCANWRQSAPELAFLLQDYDPKVIVWARAGIAELVAEARAAAALPAHWIAADGDGEHGYEALIRRPSFTEDNEPALPDTSRALLVLYTASADGRPNGAQISEPGLYLQALVHVNVFNATSATRTLVSSPGYHIVAWLDLWPTLLAGGRVCIAPRSDPAELLQLISRERLTLGTLHPPTARAMAELNRDGAYDISCFASPLEIPGWREMTRPGPGISGCGQTEVVGPVVVGAYAGAGSTPFCGRVAPIAEARVVDADGQVVASGEVGELVVRGPVAGLGYWNRPALNAARLSAGGWWHTRDLARRDADGTTSFVGPMARTIRTGGENVHAAEVEAVLRTHPAVAAAAIIGTADPDWTQLVTAVVVVEAGQALGEDELQAYVRARIARYKTPRIVHFATALPLQGAAVDYAALDRQYGGGNYPGDARQSGAVIGGVARKGGPDAGA